MSTSAFSDENRQTPASLRALRRFTQAPERDQEPASPHSLQKREVVERCEMCAAPLASEHRHLLDLAHHKLLCTCQACSFLFSPQGANANSYRLIPQDCRALPDFHMTDEQWNELMLPVNMVYIYHNSELGRVMALYPSPAGSTEAQFRLENWQTLLQANPILNELEPDVEALLINRVEHAREYYIAPIDLCYRLVGLLRTSWSGIHGGTEVWEAIAAFFAELAAKATPALASSPESGENSRSGLEPEPQKGESLARTRPEL